jgi:hypothetical protein
VTLVRRTAAAVCILTLLVAGMTSTASEVLTFVLVPLDPLFGTVVTRTTPEPPGVPVRPDPFVSRLSPRAPPLG